MASPPLETNPEEPAPAPTPTPAQTPARVTADPLQTKPAKNPGRVASGKRLAERNRLAREAKKKQQAEAEAASRASNTSTANAQPTTSDNTQASGLSLVTLLGIGGLIVSLLGVYYQREAILTRLNPTPQAAEPAPAPTPAPSRIPVKRGIKKME